MDILKHKSLRGVIEQTRNGHLWPDPDYTWRDKVSYLALQLTRMDLVYGTGGRYEMQADGDDPATWSRFVKQGPGPALECAGFVEMILYALGVIDREIFTYRSLRGVPRNTPFFRSAARNAGVAENHYEPEWIPNPSKARPREEPMTITELNGMGAWAQTPVLLFFDEHFYPLEQDEPMAAGDVLSFMSKDRSGAHHFHSAIWIETTSEHGIVHSSPSSRWDRKDGAKFTPVSSRYMLDFLQPQQRTFARCFGSAATRVKETL